jgi:PKD repeat protein
MGSVQRASHSGSAAAGRGRRGGPRRGWAGVWLGLVVLLAGAAQAVAQVVTVPAAADATIEKGSPNKSFGTQATLVLKENGSRVLVRFDVAAITAAVGGGSLATATLQVYIGSNAANWGATGRTVDVYRLDAGWTEAGATWNCGIDSDPGNGQADCAAQWNGGTAEDEATDTILVTNASQGWVQFDVTADVAAFLAGAADDGWVIEKTDEGQAGRVDLVSREGAAGLGPRLVLVSQSAAYDTVPPALSITAPSQPVLVNVPSPVIAVTYSDGGSGVDISTLHVLLDGQDLPARCTVGAQSASCAAPVLAAGSHTVTANVSDHSGNAMSASRTFQLVIGPGAGSVTLQVAADTFLTANAPDKEHGRAAALRVAKSGPSRALVSFDLSPLAASLGPAGSGGQLVSAQLEMSIAANANNWGAAGRTVGAYAVTVPWSEGAATWDCPVDTNLDNSLPDCAVAWNGGTFAGSATATALMTRNLAGTVDFDVTADVGAMLAGAANDGWLLKKTDETMSGRVDFVSREAGAGTAAQLVVAFQAPAVNSIPALTIASPSQAVIYNAMPAIALAYSESGGPGIDVTTLAVALDGTTVSGCAVGAGSATCAAPPVSPGGHSVAASVRDRAGNAAAASFSFQLVLDATQPTIAIASPAAGGLLSNGSTPVVATFSDPNAAINVGSVRLTIDGTDVTAQAQINAGGLTYTPSAPLASGAHAATVSASDAAGRAAQATVNFVVDTTVASVVIVSPADGSFVATGTPAIQGRYSDAAAGINLATIALQIDGVDVTGAAQIGAASLSYTPAAALAEGVHLVQLAASDTLGQVTNTGAQFTVDLTPPAVSVTSPIGTLVSVGARPSVAVSYSDSGSGVDPTSLKVTLDGLPAALTCNAGAQGALCMLAADLTAGTHAVAASIRDLAGNVGTAGASFVLTLDLAPVVTIVSPANGSVLTTPAAAVAGMVVSAAGAAGVSQVTVNGTAATLAGSQFAATVALREGVNRILVSAVDALGVSGAAAVTVTLDSVPPTLTVSAPANGATVNASSVNVTGQASDDSSAVSVTVNGQPAAVQNGTFGSAVALVEGANLIAVVATNGAGNRAEADLQVTRFSLPAVTIDSPVDLSYIAATTVSVSGSVSDPGATVTVNGVAAALSGTSFTAQNVPLIEGGNTVTATAVSTLGHVGTATVRLVRDLTPPHLAVTYPANGATVFDPAITVSGLVNDIVTGTVNAEQATVTVNGLPATVANRSFLVAGVPLVPGSNTLKVVAVDQSGNAASMSVTVQRMPPAGVPRLRVTSGDGQQGVIGTTLAQPLVLQALDGAGAPVAGRTVAFQVRGNNGSVGGAGRVAVVTTDASGLASVSFTLGMRAGPATQIVTAAAAGFAGPATFTEGALPGPAALLVVDSGDQQVGVAGQQLPRPLVAVVADAGFNRLGGVVVDLSVAKGLGLFANGLSTLTATSDSDGRVIVPFVLDPAEGIANNVVKAQVAGLANSPAVAFSATGWAAGPAAATSVSGVVLDHTGAPIGGVTLRILNTALIAQTDAQGQFTIAGAPVGTVILVVDGSTVNRAGSWPDLEYNMITVAGRDNTVNMPIYLLPLDLASGLPVSETQGGTLTLPELPGFALQIAAGSVTFPGGGKSGVVSVTVVHDDKVPMVPNFGQQPRLIVTIQPAGALFDPPAQLTLPNVEGLAPGEVTEMYSFDHDLGSFVSIGPATVSDDGSVVVSNPGVGVVKAGWHCDGNPFVPATLADCPMCQQCDGAACAPTTGGSCDDGDPCTVDDICILGHCAGAQLKPGSVTAMANGEVFGIVAIGSAVQFSAEVMLPNCPVSPAYQWDFDDGSTSTDPSPSHTYTTNGSYDVSVQITCPPCPKVLAMDSVALDVIALQQLTVTGDAATQSHMLPPNAWGVVKGWGPVTAHAILDPDVEGAEDLIQWSGATPNGVDANVSTQDAVEQEVTATVGTTSGSVDIWVMWATLALNQCGSEECRSDPFKGFFPPSRATFPILGPQAYPKVTEEAADGQVEVSATLLPPGVSAVLDPNDSGWSFNQFDFYEACQNGTIVSRIANKPDTADPGLIDAVPDANDTIYSLDAPTCGTGAENGAIHHTVEEYNDFTTFATWNGQPASNPLQWYYVATADVDVLPNFSVPSMRLEREKHRSLQHATISRECHEHNRSLRMKTGGTAALTTVFWLGLLADASAASDLSSAAIRLAAATNARQMDAIAAELENERRAMVGQLVAILRGESPDATKIRACILLGAFGDDSAEGALSENLDLVHLPSSDRISMSVDPAPCATALLTYGPAVRENLVKVIEDSQNACGRLRALWILYVIASSQVSTDEAAQFQVNQMLHRAMENANEGEKTMLESALESLATHPSWNRGCRRFVQDQEPERAPHLGVTELGRTAERLRAAKSQKDLDGIVSGVEDERRGLVESLLALFETQAAAPVKVRACYLLGQFHANGDKRLVENVALEWQGGRERYPCQEALARAWATAPAVVLGGLTDEEDEARRGRLVDLMIGWYGGAGTVQRLTAELSKETGPKAARLKQALAIAETYARKHGK